MARWSGERIDYYHFLLLLLLCWTWRLADAKAGLCEVETGQSSVILDIEESRGTQIDQLTSPAELPVIGDPFSDIQLEPVFPRGRQLFVLNGKQLKLVQPIDRDQGNLSHVVFQVTCEVQATKKRRTIPVIVRVSDVNDNAPQFISSSYEASVKELTPVGTTVFRGLEAKDADTGVNGLVEYFVAPGDDTIKAEARDSSGRVSDGFGVFAIRLPHQGQVTLNRSLDYERTQKYLVTIVAADKARNSSERLSSTTTLTVNVRDDDDQDPSFIYRGCMLHDGGCINSEYSASVSSGVLSGVLSVQPERIHAVDMDSLNKPIQYSFLSGTPSSYKDYFEIHPQTGAVRQIRPVDTSVAKKFEIVVKAEESSEAKRFTTAKLFVTVKPVDSSPPILTASAIEGTVSENAPIGTAVLDSSGRPLSLSVHDTDIGPGDPQPTYTYELTTNFFRVETDGRLVVNEDGLDRDPPSPGRFRFQIVAREKGGSAASAPLSLMVTLKDVNDNSPRLPMIPPVTVQAGEASRRVIKVNATDNDEGENAEISYSIYHVSNNGGHKFKIDPALGVIETTGKLSAGEQYSITVQATDRGGRSSQTIVEVTVVPGPNTRSPEFSQHVYEVEVSEGAAINATVLTVHAVDPENDPVTYSIVSGNELRQFAINDKTGVISVIRKLDREDLTRYQMLIKAEDTGGLSSTTTVNIKVSDINDKNPEFVGLPYEFTVKEGASDALVGRVTAVDADEGANSVIYYSVPDDTPFAVDAMTGEIRTRLALDFEHQQEHRFVVTARDGAPDPRLATATVTVHLMDMDDEVPTFMQTSYEAKVPENVPDFMITQVKAEDPDTHQRITYILRQGPTDLFTVDPVTGVVRTSRGLDFEREREYTLLVGTLENPGMEPGATARVHIMVEDRNDIPPVFTSVPPGPVTIDDSVPIGHVVAALTATDSDGTAPGNKVRYELIGRGKASKYFQVDPDSGAVLVRDDLKKETDTEYELDVSAHDLGEPQLSSSVALHVRVRHSSPSVTDGGLGFSDDSYTVELREDAKDGQLIKTLTILNVRSHPNAPLACRISAGDDKGVFSANVTQDRTCQLKLVHSKLDFENIPEYKLKIRLDTLSGLVNPERGTTTVKINIVDVNDNKPEFIFVDSGVRKNKYIGAISSDAEIFTEILQVKAEDKDSGKFGQVRYRLPPGQPGADLFVIEASSGVLRNNRTLAGLHGARAPFHFQVEARDDPSNSSSFNTARADVVVNVLDERHRMVLVLADAKPENVKGAEARLISELEALTGLVVGVEKVAARSYLAPENNTLLQDTTATDVWFYIADPETGAVLERNSTRVQRSVLAKNATDGIKVLVSGTLHATASEIHPPLTPPRKVITAAAAPASWDVFPYAIIVIACIVLVLGIVGIIYICISWSRYKTYKERMQRMYVVPRYDPVFVEPNLKEYETQVLQMSVPLDDSDSYNDLQLDLDAHKNHAFSLDNVSYITKDQQDSTGQQSPASSEAATTVRASEAGGTLPGRGMRHSGQILDPTLMPVTNPVYQRSLEGHVNPSSTNENVTFKEKRNFSHMGFSYLGDRSPVETTTEL